MSLQVPKSTTAIYRADDKRNPDISIAAQALSTTLRPPFIDYSPGDRYEGYTGIAVPSKALPTTPAPHSLRDLLREDSRTNVSIASTSIDHSIREGRNNDYHGNPIQRRRPLPQLPSIGRGGGAVRREAGHRVGFDFSIPEGTPATTTKRHSVNCRDRHVQPEGSPASTFFQGSSNVQITGSPNFYDVRGDATIIRFGDSQFTDVQRNLICDYIANLAVLPEINNNLKKHLLTQSITSLPRAKAVFDDYQNKKKSGPCFKGTRGALLREMADWATSSSESRMYILSGLAGIGKSTVAYTIASRAADLNLLGASFFFSRDEADRKSAEFFFTTIAYQLCVYHETFAKAIGDVLLTERGSTATTKDPRHQLQALILEPLRSIAQSYSRPILIVVDALDECDEEEVFFVLTGLSQLVRDLPLFKIILTTRPQPYLDRFLLSRDGHKIFRLQDIEDRVVDSDIRLYLTHNLSLDAVQERYPHRQWCASVEEIDSLVHAAGRLFIIASTAVRYTFDKSASNPAVQMQKLLSAFEQAYTPFKDLDDFYTIILRNVVPDNCDDHIVSRYQSVAGAIVFVQRPLPVSTLAHVIDIDIVEIREVLDNLQSVILLDSDDVPRIYHKSFPDYLTNQTRCKDPRHRIDTRIHHTQIVTCCFEIMDKNLKRNILGLGDPARFMSNEDGLKADGITDEQIQEKIPQHLRYACVYWAKHFEVANMEDGTLTNRLERFADERLLYWFEVLSLIGKLDSAHHAIGVVLKLLTPTSLDLHQLLSDALHFISLFYEIIQRSALHTYYSALPFTPSDSLLYRRHIKEAEYNVCSIEGGPEKWDALVANLRLGHEELVHVIKFSLDSTLLVSYFEEYVISHFEEYVKHDIREQGQLKIWDAATGTPISTIPGHRFAIANDFSAIASSQDNIATLYNVYKSPSGPMFTTPSTIVKLALSSESSRVAAGLSDGTVWLWNSGNAELIDCFDEFKHRKYGSWLEFSCTGTRLAYSSRNGIKLRDGISGRSIPDFRCTCHEFKFLGDGSRIVSRFHDGLTLWNGESGGIIAAIRGVDRCWAISANGALFATADLKKVTLWNGNLAKIKVLEGVDCPYSMAFSLDNILAIATDSEIKLYNIKTHSFIHILPRGGWPTAFSPDCARLAVGDEYGNVNLFDIRGIDASSTHSKGKATAVTALALSPDCSRLACGFGDGTVELWGTSPTKQRIGLALRSKMEKVLIRFFRQSRHSQPVCALEFDPDGRLFASGSDDGTIKLWNGGDGVLRGAVKVPVGLKAVALSSSVLVATYDWLQVYPSVVLLNLDTLSLIHTFKISDHTSKVSISENSTVIAVCSRSVIRPTSHVTLFDVMNRITITTFDVHSDIRTMSFLPDNSQLVGQSDEGVIQSFDLINNHTTQGPTLEHLVQLPNTPRWHGVPVWPCKDKEQHYLAALFPQHKSPVPVLWIPKQIPVTTWTQGSSIIALSCKNGRVILLRLSTSHLS